MLDAFGRVSRPLTATRQTVGDPSFRLWTGKAELFDVVPGTYTIELTGFDKAGQVVVKRSVRLLHGDRAAAVREQDPSPMVEHTGPPTPQGETPRGRREAVELGTLFVPEAARPGERLPLFVHFHGAPWLAETAARAWPGAVVACSSVPARASTAGVRDGRGVRPAARQARAKAGCRWARSG